MKTTLVLLSCIVTIILSTVGHLQAEAQTMAEANGTAVIAAKTSVKGGEYQHPLVLPANLTPHQGELLTYAYQVAKADGQKHPEYYEGLIYQESKAGGMKGYKVAGQEFGLKTMERYYGVPQLKLSAVKDVLKKYPSLGAFSTDEELVGKLIYDDHWAIRVGSKYLMMVGEGKSPEAALVAYNKGVGGARGVDPSTNPYAQNILKHVNTVVKAVNVHNQGVINASQKKINTADSNQEDHPIRS